MKKHTLLILITTIVFLLPFLLISEVPRTISYQGVLNDSEGNLVTDGNYAGTFTIYDAEIDGNTLWAEAKEFAVEDGVFTIILGDPIPISTDLDFSNPYWLGIKIGDEPEMSPRIAFTSVPYSLNTFGIPDELVVKSLNSLTGHLNLVEGNNISISASGHSITISSGGSPDIHNTLDAAYNDGGPGAGRIITANNGAVEINGLDGLKVTGTNRVIEAVSSIGPASAVWAETNKNGDGIYAVSQGNESTGSAGSFHIFNPTNPNPALYSETSGSGPAIKAIAKPLFTGGGDGSAGIFGIESALNTSTTLYAYHLGFGSAGAFRIFEASNQAPTIDVATVGLGIAGSFEIDKISNTQPAVWAKTSGSGEDSYGVYGISGDEPTALGALRIAGVGGVSSNQSGVVGYSINEDGIYGRTNKIQTYQNSISAIRAGVRGESRADISVVDNFAVAGIGYGYGTGVIGVGSSEGSGVIGVSASTNTETNAGVRGYTREGIDGATTWPPYIQLDEGPPFGKGKNGVIGQAVKKVGVWGESINKIGVFGNAGRQMGWQNIPDVVAGVAGVGFEDDSYGVYGQSENSISGRFQIFNRDNENPALQAISSGGYAAYFSADKVTYNDFAVKIETNTAGGLYVNSTEHGVSGRFEVSSSTSWGKALEVLNRGLGQTANIINYSQTNDEVTLFVSNFGLDKSLDVRSWNPNCDREAFFLEQHGNARAASVYQKNDDSEETALYVKHEGLGRAGYFYCDNTNNSDPTIQATSNAAGVAGYFKVSNADNDSQVIYAKQEGLGRGIEIYLSNSANTENALYASTYGTGRAGEFNIFSLTSTDESIFAQTEGLGRAGNFQIDNSSNNEVCLFSETNGGYRSASIQIDNSTNTSPSLFAYSNGLGEAGYFRVENTSNSDWALYVLTNGSGFKAGRFAGKVEITNDLTVFGTIYKGGGGFHIDHPLDPENKFLDHSFVESPDMKNIYDGTIILDNNGSAIVELPDWCNALNSDWRYQLTAIGAPAPNIHIAKELENNQFTIAGGSPGMKISWQVTGIRKDPWANQNRIKNEYEKTGDERGRYLHHSAYGQPKSNSIEALDNKEYQPDSRTGARKSMNYEDDSK